MSAATTDNAPLLRAEGLTVQVGARVILSQASLTLRAGEFVALVGPNGAGKTTLLRTLLGTTRGQPGTSQSGSVYLGDVDQRTLSRREVARRVAFVAQSAPLDVDFTVREVVAMGRTPYLGRFEPMDEGDHYAVDAAMDLAEVRPLAQRLVTTLSGGEKQRVLLARAFAQDTKILLLDEPNANLDVAHGYRTAALWRARAHAGTAVLAALHDLGLAARFCDRIIVLAEGRVDADGAPAEVLTSERIARVFGVRASVRDRGGVYVEIHGIADEGK